MKEEAHTEKKTNKHFIFKNCNNHFILFTLHTHFLSSTHANGCYSVIGVSVLHIWFACVCVCVCVWICNHKEEEKQREHREKIKKVNEKYHTKQTTKWSKWPFTSMFGFIESCLIFILFV